MKRFLLDAHTLLWLVTEPDRLSKTVSSLLKSSPELAVSIVSLWEIAIKQSLDKLPLWPKPVERLAGLCDEMKMESIAIERAHIARIAQLPLYHRDPFDRMLIAQALAENMIILSSDPAFPEYGVSVLW